MASPVGNNIKHLCQSLGYMINWLQGHNELVRKTLCTVSPHNTLIQH